MQLWRMTWCPTVQSSPTWVACYASAMTWKGEAIGATVGKDS